MMHSEPQLSKQSVSLCFMPQQRHLTHRNHKQDLQLKAFTRFTESLLHYSSDTKDSNVQYNLSVAFCVCVHICQSCFNNHGRNPIFSSIGWDDLDTRKHKSGILGESFLRSSNMIHQLKATAPTLSREDGEETTYSACLLVWQYLTVFLQRPPLSLTPSYTSI